MPDRPLDTMIGVKFGEVFPRGDVVGEWIATLALAFNDIAYVYRQMGEAYEDRPAYEFFYFLRLAIGHFNEAGAQLDRGENVPDVVAYVGSLDSDAQALHVDCLRRYRSQTSVIAQVRNLSAFHYPKFEPSNSRGVMRMALEDLANEYGWMFKAASQTIRDSRLLFADDIQSKLFTRATPSDAALYAAHGEIEEAIQSFMRFTNKALDEWWARAMARGVTFHKRSGAPISYGKLAERSGGEQAHTAGAIEGDDSADLSQTETDGD